MIQLDLPGHGYSQGERAWVKSYHHWIEDYFQVRSHKRTLFAFEFDWNYVAARSPFFFSPVPTREHGCTVRLGRQLEVIAVSRRGRRGGLSLILIYMGSVQRSSPLRARCTETLKFGGVRSACDRGPLAETGVRKKYDPRYRSHVPVAMDHGLRFA